MPQDDDPDGHREQEGQRKISQGCGILSCLSYDQRYYMCHLEMSCPHCTIRRYEQFILATAATRYRTIPHPHPPISAWTHPQLCH